MGTIEAGQTSYDKDIDEELFCIIRLSALEVYEEFLDDLVKREGRRGSKLYAVLKKEMQTTKLFNFEVTVRWIQEEPTSIEASFRKLKTHHLKLLQYDIHPTPEECRRYVDAITCGFREDDKVQFLSRSGHANLHESYNSFLKTSQPVGEVNDRPRFLSPGEQITSSSSESTAE